MLTASEKSGFEKNAFKVWERYLSKNRVFDPAHAESSIPDSCIKRPSARMSRTAFVIFT